MLIQAPRRVTLRAAARLAKRMAPVRPLPSLRATQSAPQKVSPAAVVSTTSVFTAGMFTSEPLSAV